MAATCDNPLAISNCAPYGMMPCTKQENVSKMEAVLLGSMSNFCEMSFAIDPTDKMATVLFAVQRFVALTRTAMDNSALLRLLECLINLRIIQSMPPPVRITISIPPASKAISIVSLMELIPIVMELNHVENSIDEVHIPIMPVRIMPIGRTSKTLRPAMAQPNTARYGIILT